MTHNEKFKYHVNHPDKGSALMKAEKRALKFSLQEFPHI